MDVKAPDLAEPSTSMEPFSFVLTELEVYNWGAFEGRHSARIDLEGTAIIGATGSGKTTLVDALMTLLTANPRYNLASTGGHESDRDLVSYCRGVSGAGNNSGNNEHIARPGKTSTGISARFSNGEAQLCIAALLWLEDSSSSATDLQRLWIFSEVEGQGLSRWLEIRQAGGTRALKHLARDTPHLRVTANKQEYLTHVRRFFEVGENAFTLLNRAAGLKQLNSIDEIFRELVLEDTSAFTRAAEVANEFDNLTAIHQELEVARQQHKALVPVDKGWQRRQQLLAELTLQKDLLRLLPVWLAEHSHRLWSEFIAGLDRRIEAQRDALTELQRLMAELTLATTDLRDAYMRSGGASIESLREQITTQKQLTDLTRRKSREYQVLARRLELNDELTVRVLSDNQTRLRESLPNEQKRHEKQLQEARQKGAIEQRHLEDLRVLELEFAQVQSRPGSNISFAYHSFRSDLAQYLGLDEANLPFVAELIEVKSEERQWRGAIERAIGGQRLRVLVPPRDIQRALAWINDRDNRLHIRLLEAAEPRDSSSPFADGFVRKLKFKPHPLQNALRSLLNGVDRHCVASTQELQRTAHGMTVQGTMSGKMGFFEKQDQRRLDQDWMTGFDNKDRLAQLAEQIEAARGLQAQSAAEHQTAHQAAEGLRQRLIQMEALLAVPFSDIDWPGSQAGLDLLSARLLALTEPSSEAQDAHAKWQESQQLLDSAIARERKADLERAGLEKDADAAREQQQSAFLRMGSGISDADRVRADGHLVAPTTDQLKELPEVERQQGTRLREKVDSVSGDLGICEKELIRAMENAKRIDTGALTEAGSEIIDVPVYLEQLRVLVQEALPDKLNRFLSYLNQSSDQGVTQLLTDINNEVSLIEERIEDLNRTLRRVDFQPERFLRLVPQRIHHESLRELQQAQRHLRTAAMKDDQGESHFRALEQMVALLRDASERKKTVSARALLDPRYRLQFAVSTIERGTGAVIETRTGSQGGSGGEKESIASYVLTASLSYALCPQDSTRPLFGTIVLDEAFSKSSHSVAGRIIEALTEFGLHPLFVTPNKELRLLRQHTKSAILVHRKGQRATMTSLSWEEIEARALERKTQQHEVSR